MTLFLQLKRVFRGGGPEPVRVWRLIAVLALPFAVQSFLQMGLIQIDRIIVGRMGEATIAGVGLATQFVSFASQTLQALVIAGSVLVLPAIGARDSETAERYVRTTLRLLLLFSTITAVGLALGAGALVRGVGAEGETASIGGTYLAVEALTLPLMAVSALASALRIWQGDTMTPVVAGIGALIVKLAVSVVLVFGTPITPALGYFGAAVAECIARVAQCWLLWAGEGRAKRGALMALRLFSRRSLVGPTGGSQVVREAAPIAVDVVLWQGTTLLYVAIFQQIGTDALAAYQVVVASRLLMLVPSVAISRAAPTLVGHALGQQKGQRARVLGRSAVVLAVVVSSGAGALLAALSPMYVGLFELGAETARIATWALAAFGLLLPFEAINMTAVPLLRLAGDARFVLVVGLCTFGVVGVAGGYLAAHLIGAGAIGMFAAVCLEILLKSLVLLRRMWRRGSGA